MQSVKERMKALFAEIEAQYDFSQFTMEGFRRWLEQRRGRKIICMPWDMPPCMSGAWLTSNKVDFIFYEQSTALIHQVHIQLHEIAHMLCGHPTVKIGVRQTNMLFRQIVAQSTNQESHSLLLRSTHSDEIELEAETLASFIQENVLRHKRLQELSKSIPAPDLAADFGTYLAKMENYG